MTVGVRASLSLVAIFLASVALSGLQAAVINAAVIAACFGLVLLTGRALGPPIVPKPVEAPSEVVASSDLSRAA